MEKNIFEVGLPKWPALVVVGKPVTKEQAMEILIRTDSLDFICNDKEWEADLNGIIYGIRASEYGGDRNLHSELKKRHGFPDNDKYNPEFWDILESYRRRYAPLELSYLRNDRIASSWIGGPHGWCSWDGVIGCSNYNIGKWPSVEEVHSDWTMIASEFPFLDLKCQLMNEEAGESGDTKPLVEFEVKDGKVRIYEPEEILVKPVFGDGDDLFSRFNDPYRERGCSLSAVREAFEFVESKINIDQRIKSNKIWKKI